MILLLKVTAVFSSETPLTPPYKPIPLGVIAGQYSNNLFKPTRKTPIDTWSEKNNAKWEPVGDWRRAYAYPQQNETITETLAREVLNVRNDVGLLDSSTLGKILVKGPDAGKFMDLIYTAIKNKLLLSIRYPKDTTTFNDKHQFQDIKIGSWEFVQKNKSKICILTFGRMIKNAINASVVLKNELCLDISIVNCRFIKPLDVDMLNLLSNQYDTFITIEEGMLRGGFGSSILEYFSENNIKKTLKMIGIKDHFSNHGSNSQLFKDEGLDVDSIVKIVKEYV